MACVMASAGLTEIFSSSHLSSRAAFSSHANGLSRACSVGSVVPRALGVRAAGVQAVGI